ncbi:MAG: HD domain-containing protein [Gammaproteobacteria bacterium]|nr:MAG: HD domain-containing protein [Gammaproteobacteria bacterium]
MTENNSDIFVLVDEYDDIKDFLDEVEEKHVEVESALLRLEDAPDSTELLNQVFRALHTIKGDANIFHIDPMVDFAHSVENLVEGLREGEIKYCKQISEIILLSMDRLLFITREVAKNGKVDLGEVPKVIESINLLVQSGEDKIKEYAPLVQAYLSGDPDKIRIAENGGAIEVDEPEETPAPEQQVVQKKQDIDIELVQKTHKKIFVLTETLDPDLQLFRSLGEAVDDSNHRWANRTAFIASIALGTNGVAGTPVDYFQLEAACYMHDIGMGFLPDEIFNKKGKYTNEELKEVQDHVYVGSGLLKRMMGWEPAAEIVEQHHEQFNGSGYPKQLVGEEICDGARIMLICDAFFAMTHSRPDRVNRKSIMRAVAEINASAGSQFCPFWVEQFNKVVKIQLMAGAFKDLEKGE